MLFNSLTFLLFFPTVLALFWLMPSWRARKGLLLLASYVFYAAWSVPYVLLLLASTLMDWWLARLISIQQNARRRRALLTASLCCNLGLLGYFKYGNFLVENFQSLMRFAGINVQAVEPGIVLPIAISFYTFASLSYTIDVYRREIEADASLLDYALFVGFFPHLEAGPIVRASYLLPQFAMPRHPSRDDVGWGLTLLILGLFAKVVLADAYMAPVVGALYAAPAKHDALETMSALLAFSGQIYFDFCGYSLCAIGLARCFGFSFPDNFRYPYAARGFSDFWRRWHISLSSWLRDYLYISLGGNRDSWRVYRNLMLTMLLAGLWHGASWMFILWGGIHGALLVTERAMRSRFSIEMAPFRNSILPELTTFLLVTLAWIPFRSHTPAEAMAVIGGLGRIKDIRLPDQAAMVAVLLVLITVAGNLVLRNRDFHAAWLKIPVALHICIVAGCLIGLYVCSGGPSQSFIYFQF